MFQPQHEEPNPILIHVMSVAFTRDSILANSVSCWSSSMMKLTSLPAEVLPDTVSFDFAKASSVLETARLAVPRTEFAVASS